MEILAFVLVLALVLVALLFWATVVHNNELEKEVRSVKRRWTLWEEDQREKERVKKIEEEEERRQGKFRKVSLNGTPMELLNKKICLVTHRDVGFPNGWNRGEHPDFFVKYYRGNETFADLPENVDYVLVYLGANDSYDIIKAMSTRKEKVVFLQCGCKHWEHLSRKKRFGMEGCPSIRIPCKGVGHFLRRWLDSYNLISFLDD